jgi:aminomethyltransferase
VVKKTPLYGMHEKLGADIIEFCGWLMPVKYTDIVSEHQAVRQKAGLFDVSHMGEFQVTGRQAGDFVQYLVTNNVSRLEDGKVLYTPMCYENGTIVDDLLVYRHSEDHYLLVVNASNIKKDFDWCQKVLEEKNFETQLVNKSDETAQLAFQGPLAEKTLQKLTSFDLTSIKNFWFKKLEVDGVQALVSRTGYTGEDGFELYFHPQHAEQLWNKILETGQQEGITPVGLGARDTLRFEACLMLYGNDIDDTTTPLEALIPWTVKFDQEDFKGKTALEKQKKAGLQKNMVGFEMVDRGIPRHGYQITNGNEIGRVTSGTFSPTLKKPLGLAYVPPDYNQPGKQFNVMIREKPCKARVVKTPFYRRSKK